MLACAPSSSFHTVSAADNRQQNVPNLVPSLSQPFAPHANGSGMSDAGASALPFNLDPFTAKQMAALQATSLAKAANRSAPGGTSAAYFGGMSTNQSNSLSAPHDSHPFAPLSDLQAPNPPMNVRPSPPLPPPAVAYALLPSFSGPRAPAAAQQCCHAAGNPQAAQAQLAEWPCLSHGSTWDAPSPSAHRRPLPAQLRSCQHAMEVP